MRESRVPLLQVRDDSFGPWREDKSRQDLVPSGAGEVSVGSQVKDEARSLVRLSQNPVGGEM